MQKAVKRKKRELATVANVLSLDVLSTWELSNSPFQLRIEHLYIGENADLIQRLCLRASDTQQRATARQPGLKSNHSTSTPSYPVIAGIRSVAQLVVENRLYCNPMISELGHLEIIVPPRMSPKSSSSHSAQHHAASSASIQRLSPPANYVVDFSSVFSFPVSISELSLDACLELSFHCVDLDMEIGHLEFPIFASTGVLRQGRQLLPFGLTRWVENTRTTSRCSPAASHLPQSHLPQSHLPQSHLPQSHLPQSHLPCPDPFYGPSRTSICSPCAASSRFVSPLGCFTEEGPSTSDEDDAHDEHHFNTLGWSRRRNLPAAQSILQLFLGDTNRRKRRRRFHRIFPPGIPFGMSEDDVGQTVDASLKGRREALEVAARWRSRVGSQRHQDKESIQQSMMRASQSGLSSSSSSSVSRPECHTDCTMSHSSDCLSSPSFSDTSCVFIPSGSLSSWSSTGSFIKGDQEVKEEDKEEDRTEDREENKEENKEEDKKEDKEEEGGDNLKAQVIQGVEGGSSETQQVHSTAHDGADHRTDKHRTEWSRTPPGLTKGPSPPWIVGHATDHATGHQRPSRFGSHSSLASYTVVPNSRKEEESTNSLKASEPSGSRRARSSVRGYGRNNIERKGVRLSRRTRASWVEESHGMDCPTSSSTSPAIRRSRKYGRRRRLVQSSSQVSRHVYRAMNCYKLLDLFKRGVVTKCQYANDDCREQIQLACERSLLKGLMYFGFVSVSLSIFPTPVLFSTTPPQRVVSEEEFEALTKQQQQPQSASPVRPSSSSSLSVWLGGTNFSSSKLPSVASSTNDPSAATLDVSAAATLSQLRLIPEPAVSMTASMRRSIFSYTPCSVLLDRLRDWKKDKDGIEERREGGGTQFDAIESPLSSDSGPSLRRDQRHQDWNHKWRRRKRDLHRRVGSHQHHRHRSASTASAGAPRRMNHRFTDDCARWYLETLDWVSIESRKSLLTMAQLQIPSSRMDHSRSHHNNRSEVKAVCPWKLLPSQPTDGTQALGQQCFIRHGMSGEDGLRSSSSVGLQSDIGIPLQQQVQQLSSTSVSVPTGLSFPSGVFPYSRMVNTTTMGSSMPHPMAAPWVGTSSTRVGTFPSSISARQQQVHQMRLLQRCWTSSSPFSDFYRRPQESQLESLYLEQQRRLSMAAMDRLLAKDETAAEGGNFISLTAPLRLTPMDESHLLEATLALTSLTPYDKRLLWRYRETLKQQGVSVLKLAAAVDWNATGQQQSQEFNELLQSWPLPSIEKALELLSSFSPIPTVRQFGCRALESATDSKICRYLPQLVQAIRYDAPGPQAPLLSVILRRASSCPRIASALHWSLQCEAEDPEQGHLFIRGQQRLLEMLAKTPEGSIGRRILKILELQRRFAVALRNLASRIRDRRDRADKKTERLRDLLIASSSRSDGSSSSSDGFSLTHLQQPVPLPIAPYGLLLGIVSESSHVVKSSQYPFVLVCRLLVPSTEENHFHGNSHQSDCWETNDLWACESIDVEALKQSGYKEIYKRYLYKTGDDLRQDQLVTQIIRIIKDLLSNYGCDYRLTVYDVVPLSRNDGLVEFVDKSEPLSSIKKSYPTLRHYFAANSSSELRSPLGFPKSVLNTFIRSCSGYSVLTFLLGVGDRHLDNLLLCDDGRLFHVDFGFIFGDDPKPFPPPMKLCSEIIEGLGGIGSEGYTTFQLMCCQCFRCIRRHSKLIVDVLVMMAHSDIKAFKTEPLNRISRMQDKFQSDIPEVEAEAVLLDIISVSANALFPAVVDKFHEWALYWK